MEGGDAAARAQPQARLRFPLDGPKTLNGLILEHLQDIPEPGTSLKIAGYPLEIVQTQDRVVKAVRIFPRRAAEAAPVHAGRRAVANWALQSRAQARASSC